MAPLEFKLDLRDPGKHEIHVELALEPRRLKGLGGATNPSVLELFQPVWTPGSYMVREYSRHLSRLVAADPSRRIELETAKTRKNRWRIALDPGLERLVVSWSVYAHELTVRTADLTSDHAFWNWACLVLWPVGGKDLAANLEILMPPDWALATELRASSLAPGRHRLEARDLDDLIDTPCLAGRLTRLDFTVLGKPHSYVLDGLEGVDVPASLVPDTQRLIEQAAKVFDGELPYERYTFLSMFSDQGRGGLEHHSSSVLLAPRTTFAPRKSYEDFVGLVAHEHFHLWNIKRMRPASLWEFDYENENYTTLLWVAEGFTSYYDDLLCLRAGVLTKERYLEVLADNIQELRSVPGRLVHPLALASFDAWIKFYRPDEHSKNSSQSYYSSGSLASLCLDLTIRAATGGARSLDHALRGLWRLTNEQRRGYSHEDVVACLSAAAGQDLSAYVHGLVDAPFEPDFASILEKFGIRITKKEERTPYVGVTFKSDELVVQSVIAGDPAHSAGLAPGDELIAIAGLRVRTGNWKSVLESTWAPGRTLEVLFARRGKVLERTLTPTTSPDTLRLELANDATEAQRRLRTGWLG